jgi:hypothetical protein
MLLSVHGNSQVIMQGGPEAACPGQVLCQVGTVRGLRCTQAAGIHTYLLRLSFQDRPHRRAQDKKRNELGE